MNKQRHRDKRSTRPVFTPACKAFFSLFTGEILLSSKPFHFLFQDLGWEFKGWMRPNGGFVVLVRSLWISIWLFLVVTGVYSFTGQNVSFKFHRETLVSLTHENIEWFGAIFGATYFALYSRFSSQWQYLADLYNQIQAVEQQSPRKDLSNQHQRKSRAIWWSAFIADAEELHLAMKPTFVVAIVTLLSESEIRQLHRGDSPTALADFKRFRNHLFKKYRDL
jgi:hypothetical protein